MTPLELYLREERSALREIITVLREAEAEASQRIIQLAGRAGIGAAVRQAQLRLVRRELVSVQRELWSTLGKSIRRGGPGVAAASAEAERAMEQHLFRLAGRRVPEELVRAQQGYATRTVMTYFSRRQHNVTFSQRVFRTRALTQGWIDRTVNRSVLLGESWRELAARVRPLISPDTAGGVSYAAKRLARTELNNAFHESARVVSENNPYTVGMQWHLSRSHVAQGGVEVCELIARGHSAGAKNGVYHHGAVPDKPHPQCRCYVTSVPMDEDAFLRTILGGETPAQAG